MTVRKHLDPSPALIGALKTWGRQKWIPFGIRDRLLRVLADPDRLPSKPFECDFAGLRFVGDLSSYIDWTVNFYGVYEPGVLAFLGDVAANVNPGSVFVDIGANVGLHTLYLAPRVARVHAFEPWPKVCSALRRNIELNALTNVTIHPHGLSDANEQIPYYTPTTANWGTGGFVAGIDPDRPAEILTVRRGDDVFAEVGIERIDLIKIDTEGYERKAMAGMRAALKRHQPIVVLEISPALGLTSGAQLTSVVVEILGQGWRIFGLVGMEKYRLVDFRYSKGETVTAVLVPEQKISSVPRSGRWPFD